MKKILQKAAALLTAGLMTVSALGAETFAQGTESLYQSSAGIEYGATLSKPKYSIRGSKGVRYIKLTSSKSGATIYYTTNGNKPTTKSKKYTGSLIKITKTTKIRAIAVYGSSKSSVMTKTVKVPTKYGDVIGDGKITSADYTRLRKYLAGNTSFVCLDNADCDGNGRVNSDDLSVLSRYLNGTISSLPYKTQTVTKPSKPVITAYDTAGGKQIEIKGSTSGASYYYTLNGTTPTTNSTLYNGKFTITTAGTKTIKAIAYKNGTTSDIQQYTVTVQSAARVNASEATTITYSAPISVRLTCNTPGASIFYTTDSTDPRTSRTAVRYYSPITVDKTTTIKAYSTANGYADSNTITYSYRFTAATITLSGNVWDDTPYIFSVPDGIRSSGESGISGIKVHAVDVRTNRSVKDALTDAYGNYTLNDLPSGTYRVVFDINNQKYRPYNSLVPNGNQALIEKSVPYMNVRAAGTYNANNAMLTNINTYNAALVNSYFNSTAATYAEYSKTTSDIGLALTTNVYGSLALSNTVTGQTKSTGTGYYTAKYGDTLTYTFSLTNNSPTTMLSDVNIGLYLTDTFSNIVILSSGYPVSYTVDGTKNGYKSFTLKNLLSGMALAPGRTVTFTVSGTVAAAAGAQVNCSAEILSYTFSESVYDRDSAPGNMIIGVKRESDETVAQTIIVEEDKPVSNAKIHIVTKNFTLGQGESCEFDVIIENVDTMADFSITPSIPNDLVTWTLNTVPQGSNFKLTFTVTANSTGNAGLAYFNIKITDDPSINDTVTINVTNP